MTGSRIEAIFTPAAPTKSPPGFRGASCEPFTGSVFACEGVWRWYEPGGRTFFVNGSGRCSFGPSPTCGTSLSCGASGQHPRQRVQRPSSPCACRPSSCRPSSWRPSFFQPLVCLLQLLSAITLAGEASNAYALPCIQNEL